MARAQPPSAGLARFHRSAPRKQLLAGAAPGAGRVPEAWSSCVERHEGCAFWRAQRIWADAGALEGGQSALLLCTHKQRRDGVGMGQVWWLKGPWQRSRCSWAEALATGANDPPWTLVGPAVNAVVRSKDKFARGLGPRAHVGANRAAHDV